MIRLAVRVRREQAELVLAELLELAPSGVEEVSISDQLTEYAVYGPPGELPALPDLTAAAGGALVDISTAEIADDWSERWRSFHQPLLLDGRLTVRPPWEPRGATPIDVVIDPGQAFGTGAHATTRLCLELMLERDAAGAFVDLGCGSGVLAIVAAKLGWAPVIALDNDPASVTAASENATANEVEIEVHRFDMRVDQVPEARLVAAHVLAPQLLAWAASQRECPDELILSGLLPHEADRSAAAFHEHGLAELERRVRQQWAAVLLARVTLGGRPAENLGHAAHAARAAVSHPVGDVCDPGNLPRR
jgi:ribosomal protein L11 methyltransferase